MLLLLLFLLIIDLYVLIAVTAQTFNLTAELVIPKETKTNEANAEIETQLVIGEAKMSKCSI